MQPGPGKFNKQPGDHTPREGELTAHWIVLILCVGILLGGAVLSPPNPGLPFLHIGHIPIPDMCSFKNLTGWPCPGCGLTRSVVAGMHGDFSGSLKYHRLGLLTLAYIMLQFFYRLGAIVFPVSKIRIFRSGKILNRGIILLAALFMLNWGFKLLL